MNNLACLYIKYKLGLPVPCTCLFVSVFAQFVIVSSYLSFFLIFLSFLSFFLSYRSFFLIFLSFLSFFLSFIALWYKSLFVFAFRPNIDVMRVNNSSVRLLETPLQNNNFKSTLLHTDHFHKSVFYIVWNKK